MRCVPAVVGRGVFACVIMLGAATAGASSSLAELLDKDACAKLTAERQSLASMGVEQNKAKGPQWASANLPPSGIDLIRRFITVDEQLKFRCRAEVAAIPPKPPTEQKAPVTRALPPAKTAAPKAAVPKAAAPKTAAPKAAAAPAAAGKPHAANATQHKPKAKPDPTKAAQTINATVN